MPSWVIIILVGLVAGWLAGWIFKDGSNGFSVDTVVGLLGAGVAAWLCKSYEMPFGGSYWVQIIAAIIGAIGSLWVINLVGGRKDR